MLEYTTAGDGARLDCDTARRCQRDYAYGRDRSAATKFVALPTLYDDAKKRRDRCRMKKLEENLTFDP